MSRIFIAFLFMFSASVFASDGANILTLDPEIQRGDIHAPQGFWPLIGVGMGATDSNSNIRTGGMPSHVKAIGSYYFNTIPWVADVGLGLHNHILTQKGRDSDVIQSLYTEVAGRYLFANKWQVGAIWNTLLDNPDRYKSNTENLASFIGVQALKEFAWSDKYLVRAGARAMTDVGISGATINTIMAEVQVSIGSPEKVAEVQAEPIQVATAPHLATRAMETIQIEPGPVNFESDSTRLAEGSQQYLRRLARVLADNQHLFDRVEVVGHTDQRGTDTYNDKLSLRRAETILSALVKAGVTKTQVDAVGKGKTELLTQSTAPSALARNRRVQLQFEGVKNQVALKHLIDSISR